MSVEVSVIIPVYKAEKTIERCVDSILQTNEESMEIILIEDGSPDNSWEACERLAKKSPQVKIIKNPQNRGVSYTRNRGLEAAEGNYIMFADSDDWVEKDFLKLPLETMKQQNQELLIFGYINHDEKHNHLTEAFAWNEFEGTKRVKYETDLISIYEGRLLQQLWNKVFLGDLIRKHEIRFDETSSMGEDFRFILQYMQHCQSGEIVLLNQVLYNYNRDNDDSLMYTFEYEEVEEPLKDLEQLYRLAGWSETKITQTLQQDREKMQTQYAYFIMHSPKKSKKEKKEKIIAIGGKKLYSQMEMLYRKEKISSLLRR